MSTSQHIAIVEAVKDALNSYSFSQYFLAERRWVPKFSIEELKSELRVCCAVRRLTGERADRTTHLHEYGVDICIAKKVDSEGGKVDDDAVDACHDFVEEITDFLIHKSQWQMAGASLVEFTNDPTYDQPLLNTDRIFSSLLTFTYSAQREGSVPSARPDAPIPLSGTFTDATGIVHITFDRDITLVSTDAEPWVAFLDNLPHPAISVSQSASDTIAVETDQIGEGIVLATLSMNGPQVKGDPDSVPAEEFLLFSLSVV